MIQLGDQTRYAHVQRVSDIPSGELVARRCRRMWRTALHGTVSVICCPTHRPSAERSSEGSDGLRYGAARGWRVGERVQHDEIVHRAIVPD
jgi:hypothetical protein